MKPIKVYACLFPVDFIFPVGKVTFALELRFCAFRHTHTFYYCTFWKRIREERKCAVFCPHFTAVAQGLKFASGVVVSLGPKNIFCSRLPSLRKWSLGCSKKTVLTYIIFCTHLWIGTVAQCLQITQKSLLIRGIIVLLTLRPKNLEMIVLPEIKLN